MRKDILRHLLAPLFAPVTAFRGAAASSIGLIVGMLPLYGIRWALLLAVSLLFRLNLGALLLGLAVTALFPLLHVLSFAVGERLAGYEIPFYSPKYLSLAHLAQWTPGSRMHLIGSGVAGLALAAVSFPAFALLYRLPRLGRTRRRDFVFQDESGRRRTLVLRFGALGLAVAMLVGAGFGASLGNDPFLPKLALGHARSASRISPVAEKLSENALLQQLREEERLHPTFQLDYRKHRQFKAGSAAAGAREVYAFYVNWDENSKHSLLQYGKAINTLLPEWYHLKPDLGLDDQTDPAVLQIAGSFGEKVEPLINNYSNDKWDDAALHRLLQDPVRQERLIGQLIGQAKAHGESGVNLDFEALRAEDQDAYTAFVQSLATVFHEHGLQVTVDVPADDDAFDYGALAKSADRLIVMMYDEHDSQGKPGPVASDNWFEQSLDRLDIPQDKLIVSMGSYGYDWVENGDQPADTLTFGDIMTLAEQSKLVIHWDDESGNPYMRYREDGDSHIVWFLDAATAYDQLKVVRDNGFPGVALWRLGSEDPTLWRLLGQENPKLEALTALSSPTPVHDSGKGEILRIRDASADGRRTFETDEDGYVADETYASYPKPFEIERYGKPEGKQVVLTFDDGPSGSYTPQILDILHRYGIHAAFFVVGENAEMHPELIERIYKEGHELGNHTFTHPNVASTSPLRTRLELNATQRLVQEITGHSMTFFRPPYVADAEPSAPSELLPILRGQEMGYTMVGELIDPEDWARPSAPEIVRRVMSQLPEGNVILLHDAGGNRDQTVRALPVLIERLQHEGYSFTTLSALIGQTREQTMPRVSSQDAPLMAYDRAVFEALHRAGWALQAIFYAAIALGVFRVAFLFVLAWRHKRAYSAVRADDGYRPFVSVVIAAYNEERVICKTIESLLESDYPAFEIVVVDDGSTDDTADAVRSAFGGRADVRLVSKANGGKASAVNAGFREARGDIVVALDADTLIARDAVSLLVRRFRDPIVAAVSGNVRVGNARNPLTIWQHIEYVTGFNLERRAFDRLNCITVVPGAIGAWRKTVVEEAGLYREDTLAEDADLTLSLLRRGWKIGYEERAYAFTEAPEEVRSFVKQRYRWTYGTLQCLWKHRGALFRARPWSLGFVGMPNMWLFQYVYSCLSPLIDLLFVFSLIAGSSKVAVISYAAFFVLDLLVAWFAFRLEGASPRPLVWLFLQRIVYRQLMAYVIFKSMWAALKGAAVGWNKLQRRGNVKVNQPS
ncbi:polysaccharide deacetylase family protein [Cohnella sp. REN36]|uniref:polysaccharide deacetylase family protein n=1 Tax=Cohnella sp. REN36 TaxID=2887347 RepID=UPI001D149545|nr:DUF2062 domain-containing protein [Cohnella sp. REN36]MCC3371748.1 DUF2062 domain-containing protein [Cohnella sp. REN36]